MNRRGFLGSILAACAAPAIVRADSLMRVIATDTTLLRPDIYLNSMDLAATLDEFSRRVLQPAMRHLAVSMERDFVNHVVYGAPLPRPEAVVARLPMEHWIRGPHG